MREKIKVWDRFQRIFHWTLVIAFVTSYLSGESEHPVHVWSGYAIGALIVMRLVWGFVGSQHARFRSFLRPPGEALSYIRKLPGGNSPRYLGHNPAGGWMVVLLLSSLLVTGFSGIVVYGLEGHGPLAAMTTATIQSDQPGQESEEHPDEELWEEIHEFFANFTLALVVLHLAGMIASSFAHRENLPLAMITGQKRATSNPEPDSRGKGLKPISSGRY